MKISNSRWSASTRFQLLVFYKIFVISYGTTNWQYSQNVIEISHTLNSLKTLMKRAWNLIRWFCRLQDLSELHDLEIGRTVRQFSDWRIEEKRVGVPHRTERQDWTGAQVEGMRGYHFWSIFIGPWVVVRKTVFRRKG